MFSCIHNKCILQLTHCNFVQANPTENDETAGEYEDVVPAATSNHEYDNVTPDDEWLPPPDDD